MTVAEAYAVCRQTARREAKNFYWAFRVLPRAKSDAMCAVYSFMRRADDLSDDESTPIEARRLELDRWAASWHAHQADLAIRPADPAAEPVNPIDQPIFLALADTQRRFRIPASLLDELIQGVTMDLEPRPLSADGLQTFSTFDDLYRYCYLVASVVGLVCIRIFGYTDERAAEYAEQTGIAFQLTNILRDVREDTARGRLYLPLDMLAEFSVPPARIQALSAGGTLEPTERALLATVGVRAEQYYRAADRLIPLLDRDSRAAMWVLKTIYHRLLSRLAARRMEVFTGRVSVPAWQKLLILARGLAMAGANRLAPR